MSTTQSRQIGEAPPVFSYAQAAKGRVGSTTASAIQSSQTNSSGMNTPGKDTSSSVNTPSGGSERGDRSVNGSYDSGNKADTTGESSTSEAVVVKAASSSVASPSFGTASTSTLPKDIREEKDADFTLVGGPVAEVSKERGPRGENPGAERNGEGNEGRRGKKGRKQKNADKEAEKEKEKEEVKPEVFVPAPLPTVNFWLQRKEELAKTKPSPVATPSAQQSFETSASAVVQSAKAVETKKGSKANGAEESDKATGPVQNGFVKETAAAGKGQKKGNDGGNKAKDEQSGKRAAPRGSRVSQKDETTATNQLPPPVDDAISWPTPETALEEKRKAQEKIDREEKDEAASNKPRPKEKWVQMPYTPSVTFNTPMPTRGGRGRGGARVGRTEAGRPGHSTNGADKASSTTVTTNNTATEAERSTGNRESGQHPRSNSLPPNPSKRQQNEQAASRKQLNAQSLEKSKSGQSKPESITGSQTQSNPSAIPQNQFSDASPEQRGSDTSRGVKSEQSQGNSQEGHPHHRAGAADRRSEPNLRAADQLKDSGFQSRERADGRSDRGRGGFRGRGGHNNFPNSQTHPQNAFVNGHGSQAPNGYPLRQNSVPYTSPPLSTAFSHQFIAPAPRNNRGSSRSQSIPNNGMYGRYSSNGNPLPQHMPPPIQTSNPMFDYHLPMQSMSAVPYAPYIDHASVVALVTMQLEYYFSIDNLCKDVYMRKHMDSQGFVFLSFISAFKRIQALTQDLDVLRQACLESGIIELVRGDDNLDRLRRKEGWEKWILGLEERDETVKNDGPKSYFHPQPSQRSSHMGSMPMPHQNSMSPPAFSPNGSEAAFRPISNGAPVAPVQNGANAYSSETPLSAAVPNFTPTPLPTKSDLSPLEAEETFSNDEVPCLMLVFQPPELDQLKKKTPYHTSSARTFSNGSIDGRSITEETHDDERQGRTLANGSRVSAESPSFRSRSPFTPISPNKPSINNAPTVMWVKGKGTQLTTTQAPVTEVNSKELYVSFRLRALKRRESSAPGEIHDDMKLLYEFWTHFLCRNFNVTMYSEFRRCALEDSRNNSTTGVKNLISYYDFILNSKKRTIPEALARHFVDLVRMEKEGSANRPAFEKLRSAWRNGALLLKSRKIIDTFVDAKLREELEQLDHPLRD